MAQTIVFIAVRILGTLAGLLGVSSLWFTQFMWPDEADEHIVLKRVLAVFVTLVAIYLLYVAYLVWWKYSPLAVRHLVAVLSLYLWTKIPATEDRTPASGLIILSSFAAMYVAYRLASYYLNRLLFPAI